MIKPVIELARAQKRVSLTNPTAKVVSISGNHGYVDVLDSLGEKNDIERAFGINAISVLPDLSGSKPQLDQHGDVLSVIVPDGSTKQDVVDAIFDFLLDKRLGLINTIITWFLGLFNVHSKHVASVTSLADLLLGVIADMVIFEEPEIDLSINTLSPA